MVRGISPVENKKNLWRNRFAEEPSLKFSTKVEKMQAVIVKMVKMMNCHVW